MYEYEYSLWEIPKILLIYSYTTGIPVLHSPCHKIRYINIVFGDMVNRSPWISVGYTLDSGQLEYSYWIYWTDGTARLVV